MSEDTIGSDQKRRRAPGARAAASWFAGKRCGAMGVAQQEPDCVQPLFLTFPVRRGGRTAGGSCRPLRKRGIRLRYPLHLRATTASPPISPRAIVQPPSHPARTPALCCGKFFFLVCTRNPTSRYEVVLPRGSTTSYLEVGFLVHTKKKNFPQQRAGVRAGWLGGCTIARGEMGGDAVVARRCSG